jgi:hypothetical protein
MPAFTNHSNTNGVSSFFRPKRSNIKTSNISNSLFNAASFKSNIASLFDADIFDNPTKASTYIYKAFAGDYDFPIDEAMQNNVSRHDLVDMMTFDRADFEKNISLSVKKKVKIESKWELKKLGEISIIDYGTRIVKKSEQGTIYPVYGGGGETFKADNFNRENTFIISRFGMSPKCVRYISGKFFLNDSGLTLSAKNSEILNQDYLNQFLFLNQEMVYLCGQGVAQKNLEIETFNSRIKHNLISPEPVHIGSFKSCTLS